MINVLPLTFNPATSQNAAVLHFPSLQTPVTSLHGSPLFRGGGSGQTAESALQKASSAQSDSCNAIDQWLRKI